MDAVARPYPVGVDAAPLAAFAAVPEAAPLDMPTQDLRRFDGRRHWRLPTTPASILLRRALIFGGVVALTAVAATQMYLVLDVGGLTLLEALVLGLYVALVAWIALPAMTALAGLILGLRRRPVLGIDPAAPLPALGRRVAILMPTYNEDPVRVFAAVAAMAEEIAATGQAPQVDFFVLSDTTDAATWLAEEETFLALRRRRQQAVPAIYYHRRPRNTDRKAGNVAEWVRRFGGAYETMIILDADSLMTGDAMVRLAAAIEAHPRVGLIQALPVVIGGRTLFARAQQFAGGLYGPLLARGLAWWHGSEGNFWGHNAAVRVAAFAEAAGLPHLAGRPPFGGHILSHDFIEAALLRRRNWAVHMVADLDGSYEEGPPALSDLAARDRRWCQGNLQHAVVLPARGLAWTSRAHLLVGIGGYITAPMWLAMLIFGVLIALQARFVPPDYFPSSFSLFPAWPAQDPERAVAVFVGTMALLLTPKMLAVVSLVFDRHRRRGFGGLLPAAAGLVAETLVSGLLAPVLMVLQTSAVVEILSGRDGGWNAQRRDDGSLPLAALFRLYGTVTLLGLAFAAVAIAVAWPLFFWMTPVVVGLVLAIPLAALSGSAAAGRAFAALGLLVIPEESTPPPIAARTQALVAGGGAAEPTSLRRFLADPALVAAHAAMLKDGGRRPAGDVDAARLTARAKLEDAPDLDAAVAALAPRELTAALADDVGLERLVALTRDRPVAIG